MLELDDGRHRCTVPLVPSASLQLQPIVALPLPPRAPVSIIPTVSMHLILDLAPFKLSYELSGPLACSWLTREYTSRPETLPSNITRTHIPILRLSSSHLLLSKPTMARTSTIRASLVHPRLCRLPRLCLKTSISGGTCSLRGPAICGLET